MVEPGLDMLAVQVISWTPNLETVGEICLREAEQGSRVGFVFLDIENADDVPPRAVLSPLIQRTRMVKVRRLEAVLRANGVTVIPSPTVRRLPITLHSSDIGIDSADSLKDYRVEGAALGIGALSSVIQYLRDSEPDIAANRLLIDSFLNSGYQSFLLTRDLIERHRPEQILVSNGRLASSKGTSEAARLAGVGVRFCELGATHKRFFLSDRPPQSFANARENLRRSWESAGEEKADIARGFFSADRGGAILPFEQFLSLQQRNVGVPSNERRRIVYFSSSDDEHAAVEDGMAHELFESQRCAVKWLVEWVTSRSDFELVVRVHPRLRALSARERNWWNTLDAPHVTVLPADHRVDSYALARSAEKVLCYRSSMGPEATYMGKVAIVLGDAVYKGLDCVYEPRTIAELDALLQATDVPPKAQSNCLPYGYERLTRGTPFRFFDCASSLEEGVFLGRKLTPRGYDAFYRTLRRVDHRIRMFRDSISKIDAG